MVSGIGERPAITHMRQWKLPGFTTGSGCIAPALSNQLFERLPSRDYDNAETLRQDFLPLEDLRDSWGPARGAPRSDRTGRCSSTRPSTSLLVTTGIRAAPKAGACRSRPG